MILGGSRDRLSVWTYQRAGEEVAIGHPGVTDQERAAAGRATLAELSRKLHVTNRRRAAKRFRKGLPGGENLARVWRQRDPAELRERVNDGSPLAVWAEGDVLHVLWLGAAAEVYLTGGIQPQMWQVEGTTDLWEASLRVRDLDHAVITVAATPVFTPAGLAGTYAADEVVWRGPRARPMSPVASPPTGLIEAHHIDSRVLGERRGVTVYRPPGHDGVLPVCCLGDGGSVPMLARTIEPAIAHGRIPAMLLVGVHVGIDDEGSPPDADLRTREYIPGEDPQRFDAHLDFVCDEVIPWARRELDAAPARWIVGGYSNSAVWAIAAALRRPQVFGGVVALSPGIPPQDVGERPQVPHYLATGTLEAGFRLSTHLWSDRLRAGSVPHHLHEWTGGHDLYWWEQTLPDALAWLGKA